MFPKEIQRTLQMSNEPWWGLQGNQWELCKDLVGSGAKFLVKFVWGFISCLKGISLTSLERVWTAPELHSYFIKMIFYRSLEETTFESSPWICGLPQLNEWKWKSTIVYIFVCIFVQPINPMIRIVRWAVSRIATTRRGGEGTTVH